VSLHVFGNRLRGPLAAVWAGLKALKGLIASENTLTGPLPTSWSGMAALELLCLEANALTGSASKLGVPQRQPHSAPHTIPHLMMTSRCMDPWHGVASKAHATGWLQSTLRAWGGGEGASTWHRSTYNMLLCGCLDNIRPVLYSALGAFGPAPRCPLCPSS
jgi:hypothetical protein